MACLATCSAYKLNNSEDCYTCDYVLLSSLFMSVPVLRYQSIILWVVTKLQSGHRMLFAAIRCIVFILYIYVLDSLGYDSKSVFSGGR